MAGLRIRIEFPDEEKYWLFIDLARIKTIQDVVDDINEKYSVVCDKLHLDDAQLFCRETVGVLQDKDLVRVSLKGAKKKKRRVTEDEENGLHVELVDEQPSKPKKKKKSKEDKTLELENPPSPVPLYEAPVVEKRKKKAVKNLSPEGAQEAPVPLNGERDDSVSKEPSEEESVKRKRRRRRRKSHHKSESSLQDTSLVLQQVEAVQQQQYYVATTTPAPRERQHVRFGDDDVSDLDTEPEFNLKTQVFQTTNVSSGGFKKPESNGIDKFDGSPNVGEVRVKGSKTPANKPAAVYHQGPSAASSPVLPQLGALLSLRSAVFSRNSNDKVITSTPSYNNVPPPPTLANGRGKPVPSSPQIAASTVAGEPTKIDPTAFPIITGPPRLNDLIAFKVLELSENYNPEVSDYMQGRVIQADPNGELTVQLLDPRVKRHSHGKFELIERDDEEEMDDEPQVEYESTVTYNWNEMIEPRLIFP